MRLVSRIVPIAALALALLPETASAEPRPTSSDLSVLSGRTLGNGETALWFDGGFPGLRATAVFAPSSRFNVGARGAFVYGSPYMGFGTGAGGLFEAPMRLLLLAEGTIDLSLVMTPRLVLGSGRLVGQEGVFRDDLGFGVGADVGARAGFQVHDRVTLAAGLAAELAYVTVFDPDADAGSVIGVFTMVAGLEALLSRDVALTVELTGGYGAAKGFLFDGHAVFRAFAGVAFLL